MPLSRDVLPIAGRSGSTQGQLFVDRTQCFVQLYKVSGRKANRMTRNPNMREAILSAAELLFSTRGFNAVSIRDIALEAGANPGSITYHFKSKDGLLLEIYKRHCGPMNKRRIELLVAAKRVRDVQDRLEAIVRAYVQPAFTSSSDLAGGGARFTRLRAVMSAEGNPVVGRIIAEIFDDTTNAFIEAIGQSLPHLPRTTIVWRSQFLLGALYYTLVNPERVTRLSRGEVDGADMAEAIEQIVFATVASLQAPDVNEPAGAAEAGLHGSKPAAAPAKALRGSRKKIPAR
jgi:AcrR family transcriptional regulator